MHLSRFTTLCPSIFWFAQCPCPLFLTSLRQCFLSVQLYLIRIPLSSDPFSYISLFIMPYPVLLSLNPSLFLSPFFLLIPVIRLNLSRHDPGYHLPCNTLSFFLRHPPLLLYILLVYSCLPDAVPHLSTVVGPNFHPPSCSVDHPPSSRHILLYGASLSLAFPCPIASYKAITLCLHPFLFVCCLFPSVCLRLSFCFSVTKAGYLSTLCI